jgi:hypothetical protein
MIDVDVVATIADMLGETEPVPVAQIRRIVSVLGAERAQGHCQLNESAHMCAPRWRYVRISTDAFDPPAAGDVRYAVVLFPILWSAIVQHRLKLTMPL